MCDMTRRRLSADVLCAHSARGGQAQIGSSGAKERRAVVSRSQRAGYRGAYIERLAAGDIAVVEAYARSL
jgi:hypothetical protein